jgi:amidase
MAESGQPSKNVVAGTRYYEISPNVKPAAEVASGESVRVACLDCFNEAYDRNSDPYDFSVSERRIPITGPIVISGARKGDHLKVCIEKISCSDTGFMLLRPGVGPFGRDISRKLLQVVPIDNEAGQVVLNGTRLAMKPMVGFVAVDHGRDISIANRNLGRYGGNMDVAEITAQTIIHLPIFAEGARVYLGDVHALMGDGEISGTGIETSAIVQVRFLLEEPKCPGIYLETPAEYVFVGVRQDFPSSLQEAAANALSFVMHEYTYDKEAAMLLLGCIGNVRLGQVVNPGVTVKLHIEKARLTGKIATERGAQDPCKKIAGRT